MTTATSSAAISSPRRGYRARLAEILTLVVAVWRQRRALARLPASRLDDLGLTEAEARREAGRPIWDVPAHWRS